MKALASTNATFHVAILTALTSEYALMGRSDIDRSSISDLIVDLVNHLACV